MSDAPTFAPTGAGAYRMRNGRRADLVPLPETSEASLPYRFAWRNDQCSHWHASGQHCGGRLPCSMDIVGPWVEISDEERRHMLRGVSALPAPEVAGGGADDVPTPRAFSGGDCPHCGCDFMGLGYESGEWADGTALKCNGCGMPGWVSCDEDGAHASWSDDDIPDDAPASPPAPLAAAAPGDDDASEPEPDPAAVAAPVSLACGISEGARNTLVLALTALENDAFRQCSAHHIGVDTRETIMRAAQLARAELDGLPVPGVGRDASINKDAP